MGFFTTSITNNELSKLQIEINQLILNCQIKLDSIEGRKDDTQIYENLKRQIFESYAIQIEKSLNEFRR